MTARPMAHKSDALQISTEAPLRRKITISRRITVFQDNVLVVSGVGLLVIAAGMAAASGWS